MFNAKMLLEKGFYKTEDGEWFEYVTYDDRELGILLRETYNEDDSCLILKISSDFTQKEAIVVNNGMYEELGEEEFEVILKALEYKG